MVQAQPVAAQRVAGIDLLRILAAVGIVWFHTEGAPCRQIGYAALTVCISGIVTCGLMKSPLRTLV
jgi:peptidoglycan/LPS O-acetylase OafA/YrhL